ncbi:MAG TPA: class I SAM-dependent methyltransferase, partial [Gaiellaceae bacterium]|nr:class I SAM-dependent methyltransferase [Gaiellaceae bacterium]
MTEATGLSDLQGPAGNTYDKYGTRNPVARYLVERFLRAVDEAVGELSPRSVLDAGCGEGTVTERIARRLPDASVVGLDVGDPGLLAQWGERAGGNLTFHAGSAYSLPYADGAFELACALEVLEHLERPAAGLDELARVSSRALVVSVPREPLWRVLNVASGRYVRARGNTPGHVNHWSRR